MEVAVKIPSLSEPEELIPTRQSLLSRLKDYGDDESWRDFFHTYWKLIYGMATRSGLTEVESQEVVQETIISVSKHMPGFEYDRAKGSFKGWLLQMTKWRIQDQFRKRRHEAGLVMSRDDDSSQTRTIEAIPDPVSADAIWEEEWQKNLVESALRRVRLQVKPKQYQIFDLYVLKKWPVAKVTATLGVNFGQVYLAKHRITALIRQETEKLRKRMEAGG